MDDEFGMSIEQSNSHRYTAASIYRFVSFIMAVFGTSALVICYNNTSIMNVQKVRNIFVEPHLQSQKKKDHICGIHKASDGMLWDLAPWLNLCRSDSYVHHVSGSRCNTLSSFSCSSNHSWRTFAHYAHSGSYACPFGVLKTHRIWKPRYFTIVIVIF